MRTAVILAPAAAISLGAAAAHAGPPLPIPKADFIAAAAGSDPFEVLEGNTALTEARDPRVRAFARQMIQAHQGTSDALRQATAAAGLPPPPGMSGDQAMLLGALQGESGPGFDRTYIRHQVLGHQQALVVEQDYATTGTDPAVSAAAVAAVPIIERRLGEAHELCAALRCDR